MHGHLSDQSRSAGAGIMKRFKPMASRVEVQKLVVAAALLIPFFFIALWMPKIDALAFLNLKLFAKTNMEVHMGEGINNPALPDQTGRVTSLPPHLNANNYSIPSMPLNPSEEEKRRDNVIVAGAEASKPTVEVEHKRDVPKPEDHIEVVETPKQTEKNEQESREGPDNYMVPDNSSMSCDFSQPRSDTCTMKGDVRVIGHLSSLILAKRPSTGDQEEATWKIKPFTRKWEKTTMEPVREFTLKSSMEDSNELLQCTIKHAVPAVVFSLGTFLGNYFHHFTDLLVPIFTTSYQYKGEVQFLVANYNADWIRKYEKILKRLSNYEIINLDQEKAVHCYQDVQVGLLSHKDLGIDPTKCPNGCTINDFRALLRSVFSLKKKAVKIGSRKPRLLLMYRTGSRAFTNRKEVILMARSLGAKVVLAGPEDTKNFSRFAQTVNSCDIMMGVHGAGLTNMLFLPDHATLIQIVPWGNLRETCTGDFGWPAQGMGLRYMDYEIKEEESTLINQYPRNHPVFTDPVSIHRQSWYMLWLIFLQQQNVKLDVVRFKGTLQEAIRGLPH